VGGYQVRAVNRRPSLFHRCQYIAAHHTTLARMRLRSLWRGDFPRAPPPPRAGSHPGAPPCLGMLRRRRRALRTARVRRIRPHLYARREHHTTRTPRAPHRPAFWHEHTLPGATTRTTRYRGCASACPLPSDGYTLPRATPTVFGLRNHIK